MWDWEPPKSEVSGAWHILRQLAMTANQLKQVPIEWRWFGEWVVLCGWVRSAWHILRQLS